MPTYNQLQALAVKDKWLNVLMTCTYNDKPRKGIVKFVKQGPAIAQSNGEFFYLNAPNGKVYIDFLQTDGRMRCFLWTKVVDPRLCFGAGTAKTETIKQVAKEAGLPVFIAVQRPRPMEG